jgi:hypothetical protein
MLLGKEGKMSASHEQLDDQNKAKAIELLAIVIDHPAPWSVIKDRAARLQARLETELPPEVISTAKAQAKNRTLAEVVAEMLPPTHS